MSFTADALHLQSSLQTGTDKTLNLQLIVKQKKQAHQGCHLKVYFFDKSYDWLFLQ